MELECSICKHIKPASSFSKKNDSKRGYSYKCKDCHNEYVRTNWYPKNRDKQIKYSTNWKIRNTAKVLATRHGLNLLDVEEFLNNASKLCQICGTTKDLVFDHCHRNLKPRGILCRQCNSLIGRLGDSIDIVKITVTRILNY